MLLSVQSCPRWWVRGMPSALGLGAMGPHGVAAVCVGEQTWIITKGGSMLPVTASSALSSVKMERLPGVGRARS